jgi:hypothetical protein
MTLAITTSREVLHRLVSASASVPVYRWIPARTDELPCYVIGRPDGDERPSTQIAELPIPVYALGRTLRDDDAQAELDTLADTLIGVLWRPPQTEGLTMRLARWRANLVNVAELEVPAYTCTVIATVAYC